MKTVTLRALELHQTYNIIFDQKQNKLTKKNHQVGDEQYIELKEDTLQHSRL